MPTKTPMAPEPAVDISQCVVLLVDDDPQVLHGLKRVLRQQPYQTCTALSAAEAINILKSNRVDLVVADQKMPHQQGTEMLAWMAVHFPKVIRIVLTGEPDVTSAMDAINKAKVFRYFTKPFDAFALAMAIRDGLENGNQPGSPKPSFVGIEPESLS